MSEEDAGGKVGVAFCLGDLVSLRSAEGRRDRGDRWTRVCESKREQEGRVSDRVRTYSDDQAHSQ